jgi:hypothetical protein
MYVSFGAPGIIVYEYIASPQQDKYATIRLEQSRLSIQLFPQYLICSFYNASN